MILAQAMLDSDQIYFNSGYVEILKKEFDERKILSTNQAEKLIEERKKITASNTQT